MSNSSKNRSYRDGKPKDEELLFRERELQKKLVKKSVASKSRPKETDNRSKCLTNDESKHRKHKADDKSEDSRRHKRKLDDNSSSKHKKRAADESGGHGSGRRSPPMDDYNESEPKERHKHRHKSRHKRRDSTGHKDSDRSHRQHRSKHSHHSKNKSGADESGWSGPPQKILRDHTSYADITPLDSKEIYAEGRPQSLMSRCPSPDTGRGNLGYYH